jgi:hypothetical protein
MVVLPYFSPYTKVSISCLMSHYIQQSTLYYSNHYIPHKSKYTSLSWIFDSHYGNFQKYVTPCIQQKFANILEVRTASIFGVEEYAKQTTCWVLFDLEAGRR